MCTPGLAREQGIFLEVSARNGQVVRMAKRAGAATVLDSGAHEPGHLLRPELGR